jgi:5'-nucleotidase
MSPRRILVSNDDGINAPGLNALAGAMAEFGEVWVVAPDRERSGAGHSLTLQRPLRIHPMGERRFSVDGTPTDCVNLALKEILRASPPDLVVSGINDGPNLGDDITYSGTVSAALEGTLLGVPSVAFSVAGTRDEPSNFLPAAHFARRLVRWLLGKKLPDDVLLNVNVPNVTGEQADAYEWTRMGKRRYGEAIPERVDPRGRKYYWIGGDELDFDDLPGTDGDAIRKGRISVTPIRLDLTHDRYLETFRREWSF